MAYTWDATISGSITFSAAAASNVSVTGAGIDLTLASAAGRVVADGGEAAADALRFVASDAAGGIDVDAGTAGIAADSTGAISLDAVTSSNFTVTGANQNLEFQSTNGRINVISNDTTANAIAIQATSGGIDVNAGVQGIDIETNGIGAPVNITATGAMELYARTTAIAPGMYIHADNGIQIEAGGTSDDLDMQSPAGRVLLTGGEAVADAVAFTASNAAGGITAVSGTGGIIADTTGAISLDGAAASNFSVTGAGIDLTLSSAAGRVVADGGEAAADAVRIVASNAAGGIDMDAGTGGIDMDTSGAATLDAASVTINATGATTLNAFGVGDDMTVASLFGRVVLAGGEAVADALRLTTNAGGGMDVDTGTGGFIADTTGAISLDGAAASNFSVTGAGIDLTLSSAAGRVVADGGEAAADAVRIVASDVAGGIDMDAGTGGITLDTTGGLSTTSTGLTLIMSNATNFNAINLDALSGGIRLRCGGNPLLFNTTSGQPINLFSAGNVDVNATTMQIDCVTGGISIDSSAASNYTTSSGLILVSATNGDAQLLASNSAIVEGQEAAADAVRIVASDAAGGIDIDSGTAGITADSTGAISLDGAAASNFSVTGAGIDLTLASAAGTVAVNSGENVVDAIQLNTTGVSAGIRINASGATAGFTSFFTGRLLTQYTTTSSGTGAACPIQTLVHEITATGAGDTVSLADSLNSGQHIFVVFVSNSGSGTNTAVLSPTSAVNFTSITFSNVGETAHLMFSTSAGGWVIIAATGTVA